MTLRQHPRFLDQQRVEVTISDREELHTLWTGDISKGGMFLQTDAPPQRGAQLQIKLSTPDGTIMLNGRVVHVQADGVGVAFGDLSKDIRHQIERYVDGMAERLTGDLQATEETEPLEVVLEQARRISHAINDSDLYGALGLQPSASAEQIQSAVAELCHRFAHPPSDCPPPKAARMAQLTKQIERAGQLFASPVRRLHYDFQHGYVRAKERQAEGQDLEQLRQVWSDVFPEKATKARELAKRALMMEQAGKLEECTALGKEALANDPFNVELESAIGSWQKGARPAPPPKTEDTSQVLQEILELGKKIEALDPHQLLGVDKNATVQQIGKAYLLRQRRFDPEQLRGRVPQSVLGIAADLQKRIAAAYQTLIDPTRRQAPVVAGTDSARTKNEMGVVLLRKSDHRQAREMFQKAVELAPDVAEYQANLAWAFIVDSAIDRGEAEAKARPLLVAAIDKTTGNTPDDHKKKARYHYYLGRLQRDLGQLDAASDSFKAALELNPRLAEATTEVRLLEMRRRKK